MSWDVYAQDFPDVQSVLDIPDDFRPRNIGDRDKLIAKIQEVAPAADFSEPGWGIIEMDEFSIEVQIGEDEEVGAITFHIRGGGAAGSCVAEILRALNLKAIDSGTGDFFDFEDPEFGFDNWKALRDQYMREIR